MARSDATLSTRQRANYRGPSPAPGCKNGRPFLIDHSVGAPGFAVVARSDATLSTRQRANYRGPSPAPGCKNGRPFLIDHSVGAPGFEPGTSASRTQRSTGLSHAPKLPVHPSGQPDSNRRPQPWQGCALPAELCPRSHRSELNRRPLDYESSALPLSYGGVRSGAGGSRTRDLMSAIHALSQLSYGPQAGICLQSSAAPFCGAAAKRTELRPRVRGTGLTGLEPATSGVTDRHSNQLSYSPQITAYLKTARRRAPDHPPAGAHSTLDGAYWTRTSDLYDVNVAL